MPSVFCFLVAVLVVGVEAGGAKRWINLAGQQFQPSEVAKFSLICMMAAMAAQYKEKMADFRYGVVRMGGVMLLILALVALEKHLSAIMIIGIVSVVMMYVGGTKKRWLFLAMGLAVVFLVLYVSVMGYAGDRITAWLNPEADAQDKGYQVLQSQYAIGSGDYSAWALAWGGKSICTFPKNTTTTFLPLSVRSWASLALWVSSFSLPFSLSGAIGLPCMPPTGFPPCWLWELQRFWQCRWC